MFFIQEEDFLEGRRARNAGSCRKGFGVHSGGARRRLLDLQCDARGGAQARGTPSSSGLWRFVFFGGVEFCFSMLFADHNPATHVQGFLTNNKDIANFVPSELFPQRKPAAWEEAILKVIASLFCWSVFSLIVESGARKAPRCSPRRGPVAVFEHLQSVSALRNDAFSSVQVDQQQKSAVASDCRSEL